MTQKEIEEYLDIRLSEIINNLKAEAKGTDSVTLSGTITGFLMKTGLKLAVASGCPKHVMEKAMDAAIERAYKKP
jgi:hypothetical protein